MTSTWPAFSSATRWCGFTPPAPPSWIRRSAKPATSTPPPSCSKFAQGAVGVIENSRRAVYGYDQRVEVFGSGGSARIDNNYPNTAILSGAKMVRRDLPLNFFMERYLSSYLLELEQFVEAARRGGPSPLSGEEGRIPVVMAIAARKSGSSNARSPWRKSSDREESHPREMAALAPGRPANAARSRCWPSTTAARSVAP